MRFLAFSLALVGCTQPTAMVIELSGDESVITRSQSMRLTIRSGEDRRGVHYDLRNVSPSEWPITMILQPGARVEVVEARVELFDETAGFGTLVSSRAAIFDYTLDAVRTIRLRLDADCEAVVCNEAQGLGCFHGECVSARVESSQF